LKREASNKLALMDGIEIISSNDEKNYFSNFIKSEEVFGLLQHLWNQAMKKVKRQRETERNKKERGREIKKLN